MGNTHTTLLYHIIFSTKNRERSIKPRFATDLYKYINGILKNENGTLLNIGGVEDHLHLLVSLNPVHSLADVVKKIKANSSKWINEKRHLPGKFFWQKGYGAFSVSKSQTELINQYIQNQDLHHKKLSFKEEYIKLLKLHRIEYDEKYLWLN